MQLLILPDTVAEFLCGVCDFYVKFDCPMFNQKKECLHKMTKETHRRIVFDENYIFVIKLYSLFGYTITKENS